VSDRLDVAVIGGGNVGLAAAHRLLVERPGLRLAVVEKKHELARHQSGHNSGALHAGLYYMRQYVPRLRPDQLEWGPSVVRAQAHVRNAPSQAATASLAIGRFLAGRAVKQFGLA